MSDEQQTKATFRDAPQTNYTWWCMNCPSRDREARETLEDAIRDGHEHLRLHVHDRFRIVKTVRESTNYDYRRP